MTMSGKVEIARVELGGDDTRPLRLLADRLSADIEPLAEQPAAKSATKPANSQDFASRVQLKAVRAEGRVILLAEAAKEDGPPLHIRAETVEYDPAKHLLKASGDESHRVRKLDKNGLEDASFDWLIINTETFDVVDSKGMMLKSDK